MIPIYTDGRVTAGSASGICDGSASMIVSGEAGVSENNLTPLTRIVSWSRIGVGERHICYYSNYLFSSLFSFIHAKL